MKFEVSGLVKNLRLILWFSEKFTVNIIDTQHALVISGWKLLHF